MNMQTNQTSTELPAPKKQVSVPVILAAAVGILASAYLFFFSGTNNSIADAKGAEPSALFDDAVACSQPGAAFNRAKECEDAATAKMQRYMFEAQDGVTAVRLGTEAEQCYLTDGKQSDAQRVRRRLDLWKQRINQDYQSARLRLRVGIQHGEMRDALSEVQTLRALVAHRNDPYTAWLEGLERELIRATEKKRRK
jgi:hypothetical protein